MNVIPLLHNFTEVRVSDVGMSQSTATVKQPFLSLSFIHDHVQLREASRWPLLTSLVDHDAV